MNLKYPFLVVAEGGIIGYTFVSCTRKALVNGYSTFVVLYSF